MVSRQNRDVPYDGSWSQRRVMISLCRREFRALDASGMRCPYSDNWLRRRRGLGIHPFLPADRLTCNESSTSGRRQCQNGGLHRPHRFCTEPLSFQGTHAAANFQVLCLPHLDVGFAKPSHPNARPPSTIVFSIIMTQQPAPRHPPSVFGLTPAKLDRVWVSKDPEGM